jgi:hypothetical protein
LGGLRGKC